MPKSRDIIKALEKLGFSAMRQNGSHVVITRARVAIVRLVGWQPQAQPKAAPGAMRGQIQISANFDAPLAGLFEAIQRHTCWSARAERSPCCS